MAQKAAAAAPPVRRPAPVSPPSATTFRDYERSGFASTAEDSVSTFSLDTDRTSFQLALNWARAGHEVDPDSVRAEEWINAFDYSYELPAHRDSFAITTDVFTHPLDSRMHLVRLGFQAPDLQDDAPLNVPLVLDASGSMSDGNRVAIAREAAKSIRRSLRSRDRIGVVHFTTDVIRDLTVKHTGPDDRDVRRSIDRLAPHDSTNVQAGLDLGVRLADRARRDRPDAHNYIILMSDGVANVDATDPFAILESAYDANSRNPLRLITIGVGINNYNDLLLEQLAQHGNGWYRYLSDVDQARADLQPRELAGPVDPVCRPDPRPGDLERRDRGVLADDRLREPGHVRRVVRRGPQRVCGDPYGNRDDGVLRGDGARRCVEKAVRDGRSGGRPAEMGDPGERADEPPVGDDGVPVGR